MHHVMFGRAPKLEYQHPNESSLGMLGAPSQDPRTNATCSFLFIAVVSIEPNCGPLVRGHGFQDTRASQKHLSEQLQSLEQNVVLKDRVRITGLVAVRKRDEGDFDC